MAHSHQFCAEWCNIDVSAEIINAIHFHLARTVCEVRITLIKSVFKDDFNPGLYQLAHKLPDVAVAFLKMLLHNGWLGCLPISSLAEYRPHLVESSVQCFLRWVCRIRKEVNWYLGDRNVQLKYKQMHGLHRDGDRDVQTNKMERRCYNSPLLGWHLHHLLRRRFAVQTASK